VTHILCPATVYGSPFLSCTVPPAVHKINPLATHFTNYNHYLHKKLFQLPALVPRSLRGMPYKYQLLTFIIWVQPVLFSKQIGSGMHIVTQNSVGRGFFLRNRTKYASLFVRTVVV
jgi:hypothetical protein